MCRFAAFSEEADPLISGAGGSYDQASPDETYVRTHPCAIKTRRTLLIVVPRLVSYIGFLHSPKPFSCCGR